MSSIVREQLQFQMIPRCLLLLVLKSSLGFLQSSCATLGISGYPADFNLLSSEENVKVKQKACVV